MIISSVILDSRQLDPGITGYSTRQVACAYVCVTLELICPALGRRCTLDHCCTAADVRIGYTLLLQ